MRLVAHAWLQYQAADILSGVGGAGQLQRRKKLSAITQMSGRPHCSDPAGNRRWWRGQQRGLGHLLLGVVAGEWRDRHPILAPRLPGSLVHVDDVSVLAQQCDVVYSLPTQESDASTAAVMMHLPLDDVSPDAACADSRATEVTAPRRLIECEGEDLHVKPWLLDRPLPGDIVDWRRRRVEPQPFLNADWGHLVPVLQQHILRNAEPHRLQSFIQVRSYCKVKQLLQANDAQPSLEHPLKHEQLVDGHARLAHLQSVQDHQ
mmetsp:Transcript_104172/g.277164  ORF Transcript_104172/g.277164 Transcript_104172/m.277164 type:complete len:261 (-) Transcript_104172:833-1615(-)